GLGIKTFIQIQLDFHRDNAIQTFVNEVKDIKEITECHHVTSGCDFILKIFVKDIKAYEKLIMEKISKISVIKTFQTMMILSTSKNEAVLPREY
ncbi:MAG: Lrp/AsnC ligand binding domain-containing protein, partial [Pyrinomonadaceae bacterium]|nr:Lrp/AsnC ligand binding domain-containing protein [Sphingobacteriaceae bacterium]